MTTPAATVDRVRPAYVSATTATVIRTAAGLALCVGSGLLAAACARPQHPPLMWLAFVPAIVAQHRVLPRRLSALGFAVAIGVYYQGYFGPSIVAIGGDALPAYERVLGVWMGLIALALAWRSRAFHERTHYRWFVLATPCAWAAVDFLRTLMPIEAGATAGYLANSFYDRPSLVQPISIFTLHALNLLVMVSNWAIALAVITVIDRVRGERAETSHRGVRVQLLAVAAVLAAWVGTSLLMLGPAATPTLRVAAVQTPGHTAADVARDVELTREAAARGARLVVWHEGGVRFDPTTTPAGEQIRALARDARIYVVVGWVTQSRGFGRNESTVFGPDGSVLGSYGKMHPVTVLDERSDVHGMFPRMDTQFGRIATIICADLDFTDIAHHWSSLGARLLAVPSNDLGISEHYTRIALRAVENDMAIVKADGGTDSAIVDPHGRIVDRVVLPQKGDALLVGDVAVGSGRSLVARVGDWFGWVLVAGVVGFLVVGWRARRAVT